MGRYVGGGTLTLFFSATLFCIGSQMSVPNSHRRLPSVPIKVEQLNPNQKGSHVLLTFACPPGVTLCKKGGLEKQIGITSFICEKKKLDAFDALQALELKLK